jgi:hypothetical protein
MRATPFAAGNGLRMRPYFWVFVGIVLVMLSVTHCSGNCDPAVQDCSNYAVGRTSGDFFGGFSTGGGRKEKMSRLARRAAQRLATTVG